MRRTRQPPKTKRRSLQPRGLLHCAMVPALAYADNNSSAIPCTAPRQVHGVATNKPPAFLNPLYLDKAQPHRLSPQTPKVAQDWRGISSRREQHGASEGWSFDNLACKLELRCKRIPISFAFHTPILGRRYACDIKRQLAGSPWECCSLSSGAARQPRRIRVLPRPIRTPLRTPTSRRKESRSRRNRDQSSLTPARSWR